MENKINKAEARVAKEKRISNLKYLSIGIVSGAMLSPIFLFSFGYIVTSANVERISRESANKAEALAVTPYCVANFHNSSNAKANLAALQKVSFWERGEYIMNGGWAKAPDGSGRGSQVANACADQLLAEAKEVAEKSQ